MLQTVTNDAETRRQTKQRMNMQLDNAVQNVDNRTSCESSLAYIQVNEAPPALASDFSKTAHYFH